MSAAGGLYERVLAAAGGELPPARPPRPSAAVVLWRRAADDVEVYWIRRGRTLPFMAGWHAFPGGALERSDVELPVAGAPAHPNPSRPTPPAPDWGAPLDDDLIPGIAAAALRELLEEVGVCVATGASAELRERWSAAPPSGRGALMAELAAHGAALDASRLRFAGRWLTPPFSPVRFDNRFFLAAWRAGDGEPRPLPPESDDGEWIRPQAALERLAAGGAMAAPPIVHLLRGLAATNPEASLPALIDTSAANLGPLRRIELRPGVLLFPLAAATLPPAGHTNAFVVGTGECVLIDPGSPFPQENARLLAALAAAERSLGRRVREIWLSHHHPDHVAGAVDLARQLGVPIAAHAATARRVAPHGIAVERELGDGECAVLAGEPPMRLRLHHTPGHARGHLAFEVEGAGDLLAGDLVAGFSTIVIDPPEGDLDDYLASLASLRGRGFRTLFPSHGAPILDVDAKLTETIDHRLERERQILAAWRRGVRLPGELVATIYADTPEAIRPLAERQLTAHLERLERRGEI